MDAVEPFYQKYADVREKLIARLKSDEGMGYSGGFTASDLIDWLVDKDFANNEEEAIVIGNFLMADQVIIPISPRQIYFWKGSELYSFLNPPIKLLNLLTTQRETVINQIESEVSAVAIWVKIGKIYLKDAIRSLDLIAFLIKEGYCDDKTEAVQFVNLLMRATRLSELTNGRKTFFCRFSSLRGPSPTVFFFIAFSQRPTCYVYFSTEPTLELSDSILNLIFKPAVVVDTPSPEGKNQLWATLKVKQETFRKSTPKEAKSFRKSAFELDLPVAPPPLPSMLPPPTVEYKYELDISLSGIKIIK